MLGPFLDDPATLFFVPKVALKVLAAVVCFDFVSLVFVRVLSMVADLGVT